MIDKLHISMEKPWKILPINQGTVTVQTHIKIFVLTVGFLLRQLQNGDRAPPQPIITII